MKEVCISPFNVYTLYSILKYEIRICMLLFNISLLHLWMFWNYSNIVKLYLFNETPARSISNAQQVHYSFLLLCTIVAAYTYIYVIRLQVVFDFFIPVIQDLNIMCSALYGFCKHFDFIFLDFMIRLFNRLWLTQLN